MRSFLQGVSLALLATVAADTAVLGEKGITIRVLFACLTVSLATLSIWEEP